MVKHTKEKLKIITLGQFKVYRGDRIFSEETGNYNKVWKLFQYLLTKEGNCPHLEEIMATLWPNQQVNDINHTLRNLIYRLRKILDEQKTGSYIKLTGNTYNFNFNTDNYWWDAEEFVSLSKQGHETRDKGKAIALYRKALSLYQGFYLQKLIYEDWTSSLRNYLHRIYLDSILQITEILKKLKEYEEIRDICETALDFEQFEEMIHINYIDALIELGKKSKARTHYDYVTSFFDQELGIEPSPDMKSLLSKMKQAVPKFSSLSLQDFTQELTSVTEKKGAFICEPSTFARLCHLEQARAERNGQTLFICSLSINIKNTHLSFASEREQKMIIIEQILLNCLRKGDIISRWQENEFLLILIGLNTEETEKVIRRIENKLRQETDLTRSEINSKYKCLSHMSTY